jgi:hypothetical protein
LSALTALQHLDLKQAPDPPQQSSYSYSFKYTQGPVAELAGAAELSEALPQLTQLTRLCLEWQISMEMKVALGALTQLKELKLQQLQMPVSEGCTKATAAPGAIPGSRLNLPHSITRLEVQLSQHYGHSDYCTPDLASLTALQHLQLKDATWLDTTLMYSMTQLTHLELCMGAGCMNGDCMEALLDVLADNTQLRHLQLEIGNQNVASEGVVPIKLEQCSALTSSSHLTTLKLSGVQLPPACGKALFPAGRTLPHLTTLKLRGKAKGWWYCLNHQRPAGADAPLGPAGDIYSLVECCPNLVELDLAGSVQSGVNMSGLRHLLRLTSLVVGGQGFDDGCAAGLACIWCLDKLTVIDPAQDRDKSSHKPDGNFEGAYNARYGGYGGYGGYGDGHHHGYDRGYFAAKDKSIGHFTFRGLHSLMQLNVGAVAISGRRTCLLDGMRLSDVNDLEFHHDYHHHHVTN